MACSNAPFSLLLCRSISHRIACALLAVALTVAFSGCTGRSPAQALIGNWHGSASTGNLSVLTHWKLRPDGSESVTLTLPQGLLTVQGSYAFRADTLTICTTGRAIFLSGEAKVMPLISPMETIYQCRINGDTLILTRLDTHETITLTRDAR